MTSYLCEAEVTVYVYVVTSKYHMQINVEHEMMLAVFILILRRVVQNATDAHIHSKVTVVI